MIVIDASALIEVVLKTSDESKISSRIFGQSASIHAPHIIDLEVTQAIRRFTRVGQVDLTRASNAFDTLADFPITRYSHFELLPRIWDLRHNLTAYDGAYVALAELLDVPLITRDARLATAAGHHAQIELL